MGSQYAGANAYPTDFTIPDDGDDIDAASVNVALEALGNRTRWLKGRTGEIRPMYADRHLASGIAPAAWDGAAYVDGDAYTVFDLGGFFAVAQNDLVQVELTGAVAASFAAPSNREFIIQAFYSENGGGTLAAVTGAFWPQAVPGDNLRYAFALSFTHKIVAASPGDLVLYVNGKWDATTGSPSVQLTSISANLRVFRPAF